MPESYLESVRRKFSGEDYLTSIRKKFDREIYLTLQRYGSDSNGDEQGVLKVIQGGSILKSFSTRENDIKILKGGKEHDCLKRSSLRVGVYEFEHSMKKFYLSGKPMKVPIKCLRPTDSRINKILIHRASDDDPDTLAGCIAPGIRGYDLWNFKDSEKAMEELFIALGGYVEKQLVTLKVLNNASRGVKNGETKENWERLN